MKLNVNSVDRVVRILLGLALIIMLFTIESGWRWVGLFGFVLLGTAAMSWCPIYAILGLSTRTAAHAKSE